MGVLKKIFTIPNLVTVVTIVLGAAASIGITENFYPTEKVLTALVTLVAAQLLVDRLGILSSIYERVGNRGRSNSVEILPRTDPSFERFSDFAKSGSEVMVIGIDLGFMANADAWFIKQALEVGVDLKLLIVNPKIHGPMRDIINNHDERNSIGKKPIHDHVASAEETLETLSSLIPLGAKGKLEIRARADIPNPTMALVDPTKPHGKIRVELKLYKKNHGDVPYFVLTRSSEWYDMFFTHYYVKLWGDSEILYQSWGETAQVSAKTTLDNQPYSLSSRENSDAAGRLPGQSPSGELLSVRKENAEQSSIEGQVENGALRSEEK